MKDKQILLRQAMKHASKLEKCVAPGMNRTKIEWCDYTWNPVTGCWGPGGTAEKPKRCWYCYAEKVAKRFYDIPGNHHGDAFHPRFHPDRSDQPSKVKKPSRIFVCSMGDLFGDWVPYSWIGPILHATQNFPQHTYIFLTKNPKRYEAFNPWPSNCWLGTTVTNQQDADERIPELLKTEAAVRFVSVEPMQEAVNLQTISHPLRHPKAKFPLFLDALVVLDWLIIGALTGPGSKAHQPKPEWVQSLIRQARSAGVPVFLKDNLEWPEKIQEWPSVSRQSREMESK